MPVKIKLMLLVVPGYPGSDIFPTSLVPGAEVSRVVHFTTTRGAKYVVTPRV